MALVVTFLASPILIFDNLPQAGADDEVTVETAVIRVDGGVDDSATTADADDAAAESAEAVTSTSSTSVTSPPSPPTSVPLPTRPTMRPKPTTTSTVPPSPAPTTTPQPPALGNSESGGASWYDHRDGICAHRTIPLGTIITVTNLGTGASVNCEVGDRGPYVHGRIIDLDDREFAQIARLSSGVIDVRITW